MNRRWVTCCASLLAWAFLGACGGHDPCGDKVCGDPCQLCADDDSECREPPGEKVCNANQVCTTAGPPICS